MNFKPKSVNDSTHHKPLPIDVGIRVYIFKLLLKVKQSEDGHWNPYLMANRDVYSKLGIKLFRKTWRLSKDRH